jgi:hypothetical protein
MVHAGDNGVLFFNNLEPAYHLGGPSMSRRSPRALSFYSNRVHLVKKPPRSIGVVRIAARVD